MFWFALPDSGPTCGPRPLAFGAQRAALTKTRAMVVLLLAACGSPAAPVLKNPFSGLQAGVCQDNTDCEVGLCPNACNKGQPFCVYPPVFARTDIVRKCPCVDTPTKDTCAAPSGDQCGAVPECAGPADADKVLARCINGMCAARFPDGGIVP